ncbi:peptidase [Actinomadura sp. DC4]|uniref:peptidase n=1 Tax=Actinomadura sp. DC4 TaxID=3055069 RepID=UPI0025B0794D|nr:peptidase [Actinomadura sp. DC4]MDN3351841.1 peptidase [Actinomadura sp. DC4]
MTIVRLLTTIMRLLAAGSIIPAAGSLGGTAAAAPRPHSNGIELRLVDAPVSERPDSRAWRYIIDHLPPGAVIHRRVQITNTTGSTRRIALYAAAAQIGKQKFQFAPARTPNELSTWTKTDKQELTLPPHTRSMVTTTINVPGDAAPGERYAVVWAETAAKAPSNGGVAEINRVGIRIYLSVGPGNPPAAAFTIDSITALRSPDGRQAVQAQVHNTGGRALDLSGSLKLTNGPGSLNAGPFPVQTGTTLAPGDSGSVSVPLEVHVPNGPWRAHIRLRSGLTQRTAEATITFPISAGRETARAETAMTYPLVALIVGLILTSIIGGRSLIRRRRRNRA